MQSWRKNKLEIRRCNDAELRQMEMLWDIPMPEVLTNWISQLILLKDVPLAYLVVDERELPMESIRFFNVDPQWTEALVEGALSIGAITKKDTVDALRNAPNHFYNAKSVVKRSRYGKMHANHLRQSMNMETESHAQFSGFMMRSDLVSTWKEIEVEGYLGSDKHDIVRMEILSEKVLICIFEGEIDTVKMYEPKEVLHFGTRNHDRLLEVRRIDEGHVGEPLYKAGTEEKVTITVPTTDKGRLKVSELKDMLSKALGTTLDTIESPQLALEMLSVAGQCVFEKGE